MRMATDSADFTWIKTDISKVKNACQFFAEKVRFPLAEKSKSWHPQNIFPERTPKMVILSTTHNVLPMPKRLEHGRIWFRASSDCVSY